MCEEPYGDVISFARRFVGIGRSEFSVPLIRAAEAPTYHLDITGPAATYFEESSVVFAEEDEDDAPTGGELIHVAPLHGDSRAHIHVRDFGEWVRRHETARGDGPMTPIPAAHVRLRERPPALIGPTFGLSLWVWLLTWSVGYLYPVLFPPTSGIQTAWTTVVLAVPALLTGWLLSRLTAETVRFMSASAFALIVWLSINVAAVVTVCALTMSGASMIEWDALPGTIDLLHPEWVFLLASTAAHLCASALLFVGRGLRYSRTVKEGASR